MEVRFFYFFIFFFSQRCTLFHGWKVIPVFSHILRLKTIPVHRFIEKDIKIKLQSWCELELRIKTNLFRVCTGRVYQDYYGIHIPYIFFFFQGSKHKKDHIGNVNSYTWDKEECIKELDNLPQGTKLNFSALAKSFNLVNSKGKLFYMTFQAHFVTVTGE